MAKASVWAAFSVGYYTIKYSKENKAWQVWNRKKLVTDFKSKNSARTWAERHKGGIND